MERSPETKIVYLGKTNHGAFCKFYGHQLKAKGWNDLVSAEEPTAREGESADDFQQRFSACIQDMLSHISLPILSKVANGAATPYQLWNNIQNFGIQYYATKSCTSCREKRRKCDRNWPSCQKCAGRPLPCKYPSDTAPTYKPPPTFIPRKENQSPLESIQKSALHATRSCTSCRQRRKKCDRNWPSCQRCNGRPLPCKYPSDTEPTDKPPPISIRRKENKSSLESIQKSTIHATRSCTSCRQRRKKCDRNWPSCQRCNGRPLPCKYPSDTEPTDKPPPISIRRKENRSPLETAKKKTEKDIKKRPATTSPQSNPPEKKNK